MSRFFVDRSKDENQKIFGVQSILSLAIADEERAFKEVYPSIEAVRFSN